MIRTAREQSRYFVTYYRELIREKPSEQTEAFVVAVLAVFAVIFAFASEALGVYSFMTDKLPAWAYVASCGVAATAHLIALPLAYQWRWITAGGVALCYAVIAGLVSHDESHRFVVNTGTGTYGMLFIMMSAVFWHALSDRTFGAAVALREREARDAALS